MRARTRFAAPSSAGRRDDAYAGRTLAGPHRADLAAVYAAKDVPARQCSTGEQKALLLSIVLANARALAADVGAPPLLLLDEVGAHLDAGRREALYAEIVELGAQAWMTGHRGGAVRAPGRRRAAHRRDRGGGREPGSRAEGAGPPAGALSSLADHAHRRSRLPRHARRARPADRARARPARGRGDPGRGPGARRPGRRRKGGRGGVPGRRPAAPRGSRPGRRGRPAPPRPGAGCGPRTTRAPTAEKPLWIL